MDIEDLQKLVVFLYKNKIHSRTFGSFNEPKTAFSYPTSQSIIIKRRACQEVRQEGLKLENMDFAVSRE